MTNLNIIKLFFCVLLGSYLIISAVIIFSPTHDQMNPNEQAQGLEMEMNMETARTSFISQRDKIVGNLMAHGDYRCCLMKPCTYCIEKTPGHGEGATCDCLADIVDGKHPCGECIGEILEGHGNPYLSEYFPEAIADELGQDHLDEIRKIIEEKYGEKESE